MNRFLKNQRFVFISIFGGLIFVSLSWYFLFYVGLSKEHRKFRHIKKMLTSDVQKFREMESQMITMQTEWDTLNSTFGTVIDKIPDKREFEIVTDYLYSLIMNHGLKIKTFSPSNAAIEKKTILLPETGNEIMVEKIPIDISLKGSFINFGQLLESMLTSRYRLTTSNIEIIQKGSASATINLISYAYFQSLKNKPLAQTKIPSRKKKNLPLKNTSNAKVSTTGKMDATAAVDKTIKVPDSLQGVPEMWLEPATEPIDETILITGSKPVEKLEPAKPKKKDPAPFPVIKKENSVKNPETKQDFHSIVILDSRVCKKVKNNQPLYTGRRFPTDIGRVYCHSLLNNNSGKHSDIYHIWYMNGELKAKVRIRVRDGEEIPAVSHREVAESDKGTWKVEITDSDKKILDTIIFELV